nr:G protein-coupled receptor [Proales similis]
MQDASIQLSEQIGRLTYDLDFYLSAVLYPLGIVQNFCSLYLFSRPNLNKTNMGFLYTWQTAVDIATLLLFGFFVFSTYLFNFQLFTYSDFLCRFLGFTRRWLLHASSWITLLITFDRYMLMCHPGRLPELRKSHKRQSLLIVLMLCLIGLVDVENLFYYLEVTGNYQNATHNESQSGQLLLRCTATPLVAALSDFISILMRTYVPFAIMTVLDVVIVRRLVKSKNQAQRRGAVNRERHFTIVVLGFNFLFFLFNFPLSLIFIVMNVYKLGQIELAPVYAAVLNLVFLCSVQLSLFIKCFSFVFNLAINHLFRDEALTLLACGRRVHSSSNRPAQLNQVNDHSQSQTATPAYRR